MEPPAGSFDGATFLQLEEEYAAQLKGRHNGTRHLKFQFRNTRPLAARSNTHADVEAFDNLTSWISWANWSWRAAQTARFRRRIMEPAARPTLTDPRISSPNKSRGIIEDRLLPLWNTSSPPTPKRFEPTVATSPSSLLFVWDFYSTYGVLVDAPRILSLSDFLTTVLSKHSTPLLDSIMVTLLKFASSERAENALDCNAAITVLNWREHLKHIFKRGHSSLPNTEEMLEFTAMKPDERISLCATLCDDALSSSSFRNAVDPQLRGLELGKNLVTDPTTIASPFDASKQPIALRTMPLGRDRYKNTYWRFGGAVDQIFIHFVDRSWGYYDSQTDLDNLLLFLNEKGKREFRLRRELGRIQWKFASESHSRPVDIVLLDFQDILDVIAPSLKCLRNLKKRFENIDIKRMHCPQCQEALLARPLHCRNCHASFSGSAGIVQFKKHTASCRLPGDDDELPLDSRKKTRASPTVPVEITDSISPEVQVMKAVIFDLDAALPRDAFQAVYSKKHPSWIDTLKSAASIDVLKSCLRSLEEAVHLDCLHSWFNRDLWRQQLNGVRTISEFSHALFLLDAALLYSTDDKPAADFARERNTNAHLGQTCALCGAQIPDDKMIRCSNCPRMFHIVCTNSSNNRTAYAKWLCNECEAKPKVDLDSEPQFTFPTYPENFMRYALDVFDLPEGWFDDNSAGPAVIGCGCRVCHGIGNDADTLLCDRCDAEYHMKCLGPPLLEVPEGSWFCPTCSADR